MYLTLSYIFVMLFPQEMLGVIVELLNIRYYLFRLESYRSAGLAEILAIPEFNFEIPKFPTPLSLVTACY